MYVFGTIAKQMGVMYGSISGELYVCGCIRYPLKHLQIGTMHYHCTTSPRTLHYHCNMTASLLQNTIGNMINHCYFPSVNNTRKPMRRTRHPRNPTIHKPLQSFTLLVTCRIYRGFSYVPVIIGYIFFNAVQFLEQSCRFGSKLFTLQYHAFTTKNSTSPREPPKTRSKSCTKTGIFGTVENLSFLQCFHTLAHKKSLLARRLQ